MGLKRDEWLLITSESVRLGLFFQSCPIHEYKNSQKMILVINSVIILKIEAFTFFFP